MNGDANSLGVSPAGALRPSLGTRLRAAVLVLLTVAAVVFAALNFSQRLHFNLPEDGAVWWDTASGVVARRIAPDSPAAKAGLQPGDVLIAVNGSRVRRATDVTRDLYAAGLWAPLDYRLLRQGTPLVVSLVSEPAPKPLAAENYLRLVGLAFLLIGLFVLLRRWKAQHAIHFYLFCLVSFILFSFHYSGKLSGFDQEVYWANVVALLLQPALLAHFAMVFPERPREGKLAPGLIYLLPAALLALHVSVAEGLFGFHPWIGSRVTLDEIELGYFGALTLAAASLFYLSYRRAPVGLVRQQLKVTLAGVVAGTAPFIAIYIVPYFLGLPIEPWMNLSVFFLALVPIGFAYAIIRYRLMDVDILLRRGLAHTVATAGVVAAYFALVAAIGLLFHAAWTTGPAGVVLAIVAAAFLFEPLRDWVQQRLDRFFYRDRLDYRSTLLEFGRTLTTEVHREPMLSRLLDRLSHALLVDRMAIFVEDSATGGFTLARSLGVGWNGSLDLRFLAALAGETSYLFVESAGTAAFAPDESRTVAQLGLNYFLACRVHDRTVAVLGLGKSVDGDFLTSDDLNLLFAMTGYIAIAIENARLYHSLEREAAQTERLKDFSESIVESLSVGVLTTGLDGRIESWNGFLESRIGVSRGQAVGRPLEEVLSPELAAEVALASPTDREVANIYKFPLRKPGADLVVNIAIAPLVGKTGERLGLLMLLDDITERIHLEDQMRQNEKLSSLGLLAAGVAHEVNTPLAVISNYAQMLARQMERDDPRRALVDKIVKQTFRASEITSHLLNFSRTAGAEYSEVDLNGVIRETLALVRHPLATSRVEVDLLLDSELPALYGNSNRLQQVFLNLFLNARDAMPAGGRLTVVTSRVNSHIEVHVSDTGQGIRPEHIGRIFDPFFTTKTPGRGTGLGLAVTYGIIQEHAGKVEVQSGSGTGTTFRLEFPAGQKTVHA